MNLEEILCKLCSEVRQDEYPCDYSEVCESCCRATKAVREHYVELAPESEQVPKEQVIFDRAYERAQLDMLNSYRLPDGRLVAWRAVIIQEEGK
jgi:hypothetical protein